MTVLPGEAELAAAWGQRRAGASLSPQRWHHFVSTSPWPAGPVEDEPIRQADQLLGEPDAVLAIDDTALPK